MLSPRPSGGAGADAEKQNVCVLNQLAPICIYVCYNAINYY